MADERKKFQERLYMILENFIDCPSFVVIPKIQQDEIVLQIMDSLDYFDLYDTHHVYPEGGYFK